ncbi:MAG: hypothetical protein HY922_17410 [Elusimicrobia bacterium]|nr:hypothetical protein [Elusimicrobiota bacterium]
MALAVLFVIDVSGAAAVRKQKAKTQAASQDRGWVQYEGPFIRFRYLGGWKITHWIQEKTNERHWVIAPPDYLKNDLGAVRIIGRADGREKRPLDEIFNIKEWRNTKLVNQPGKTTVRGGRCITYPLEISREVGAKSEIISHCYDKSGSFYDIWAEIDEYMEAGKPTEAARTNARIYEGLLASLEFL